MTLGMKHSLIPKGNRKKIYEYLFKEGVMVVQKNPKLEKHPELEVPNLHAMMSLRSLKSRNYVEEKFNWQHHYYFLTNEGIEHLRQYLHLPATVFPATLARKSSGGGDRERGEATDDWRSRGGRRGGGGGGGGGGFGRGAGGPRRNEE